MIWFLMGLAVGYYLYGWRISLLIKEKAATKEPIDVDGRKFVIVEVNEVQGEDVGG